MAVVGLSGVAMPETEPLGEPRTSEVGVPAPGPCRPEGGVEVGRRTEGEVMRAGRKGKRGSGCGREMGLKPCCCARPPAPVVAAAADDETGDAGQEGSRLLTIGDVAHLLGRELVDLIG
jgi:hypothetical protein